MASEYIKLDLAHAAGFQPGKSCVDAVVNISEKLESAFKANKIVLVIYLDIAGAFDGAWHPAVLNGLIERECPQTYVSLINSFLTNRAVQLNLGNVSVSNKLTMSSPQGVTLIFIIPFSVEHLYG